MTVRKGAVVISRDGQERGTATGGTRACVRDCRGRKFGVRWGDGELTWVCITDVVETPDGLQLANR